MRILPLILAASLSLSLSAHASNNDHIINYCNHIGGWAVGYAMLSPVDIHYVDVQAEASYIATKTAFEYKLTKSKIEEIATDPKISTLSPSEFAGFHFFWCVYDLTQVPFGSAAFAFQDKAIQLYQTTINRK